MASSSSIDLTMDDDDDVRRPECKRPRIDMPDLHRHLPHRLPPPYGSLPSTSNAFSLGRSLPTPTLHHTQSFHPQLPFLAPPLASPALHSHQQVIDLTGNTPSPPPSHRSPHQPVTSFAETSATTAVCIGQLGATALVLYPIAYLCVQTSQSPQPLEEWAAVRLRQDDNAKLKSKTGDETIHIHVPLPRVNGSLTCNAGDNFGVVEQKVANTLGPLLRKGLVKLDARVRRGAPNMPILPLEMMVFTPKGNISVVSQLLSQGSLFLDHPSPANSVRLMGMLYSNPHNPPPGGFRNAVGRSPSRWNSGAVSAKSVEVQRSQVDELFKNMKTGDEFPETEPTPDVATHLYPHQKKALTFLLEREREVQCPNRMPSSLWTPKRDAHGHTVWYNLVTQREVSEPPKESKGALLADDMGLGKTISCVALLASTLQSAREFGRQPLTPPAPPSSLSSPAESSLSASHFAGSVWGMPDTQTPLFNASTPLSSSGRSTKEATKEKAATKRATEEFVRLSRLKARSRGTLIVCPLSTVANWEEQFKEHWKGEVIVVGGGAGSWQPAAAAASQPASNAPAFNGAQPFVAPVGLSSDVVMGGEPLPREVGLNGEGFSCGGGLPVMSFTAPPRAPVVQPQFVPATNGVSPKTGNPLRMYIYHGNARRPEPSFLADFDIVITTYATLASEFSRQTRSLEVANGHDKFALDMDEDASSDGGMSMDVDGRGTPTPGPSKPKGRKKKPLLQVAAYNSFEQSSPLQSIHWFRIILDEAHSIKETSTVGCRASCDLVADRRVCLTGTPVQNKLDDIFALVKFLRLDPFDDKAVWTEYIGGPVKFGQHLGVARLQTIMKCITLRRTKESKTKDGKNILSLPPRKDELRYLKFDEHEQAIYNGFFDESKAEFNQLSRMNSVMKNYVGILQKILRLRQICDHYQLVEGKGSQATCVDTATDVDEVMAAIAADGLNACRGSVVFALLRETGTAQCSECGTELATPLDNVDREAAEMDPQCIAPTGAKRGRKTKASASAPVSRGPTRPSSPAAPGPRPVITRCQHLYCVDCFRNCVCAEWPESAPEAPATCTTCSGSLMLPADAVEVAADGVIHALGMKKKSAKREKRLKGSGVENFAASTKVRALLDDLLQSSRENPHSTNYDPAALEFEMVDQHGNNSDDNIVKTVVFSQWTSMLDKIEDALEVAGIQYDRLDGTMKRDERTRAMEALKHNPACEVLLVSLKAGGVGLNLTAAQRVYLMDPYWNPAVENQAVDRIHRLGQTRPVTTVKLIIENSIEARLLEVQKKKTALANMTLGQTYSKAELLQRRMEDLQELFG